MKEAELSHFNHYEPKPKDTSGIKLDEALKALGEEMARNVHETWAKARIDEGWKYGPERDDKKKRTSLSCGL